MGLALRRQLAQHGFSRGCGLGARSFQNSVIDPAPFGIVWVWLISLAEWQTCHYQAIWQPRMI